MRINDFLLCNILSVLMLSLLGCAGQVPQSAHISPYNLTTHSDVRFQGESQPSSDLQSDACMLLDQRPHWRNALVNVREKWGLEPWFILAFLHQESRFNPTALSKSRAYGFAQVKDESWEWYVMKTGNVNGSRERFDDAVDFIGLYATSNVIRNGVALNDVKNQYLAYHEGMGGFERGSYLGKPWLLKVTDKVVDSAAIYQAQLIECPIL